MTRDEVKAMLNEIGIEVSELADEAIEKIQEKVDIEKEQLDTKTRREVRKFWIFVSVLCLFLGYGLSFIF